MVSVEQMSTIRCQAVQAWVCVCGWLTAVSFGLEALGGREQRVRTQRACSHTIIAGTLWKNATQMPATIAAIIARGLRYSSSCISLLLAGAAASGSAAAGLSCLALPLSFGLSSAALSCSVASSALPLSFGWSSSAEGCDVTAAALCWRWRSATLVLASAASAHCSATCSKNLASKCWKDSEES